VQTEKIKVYWDSNCFLGLLKKEIDKISACQGTIKKAEKGEILIVTSAITFIEVIKMPGEKPLKQESEKIIEQFFKNSFMHIINVDREIGVIARELLWKHEFLKPKDSIHVASAIFHKIQKLNTFDENLLKLTNKYGNPKLMICTPDIGYQPELFEQS
jgi:predicted nucleic acid-binding protein